MVLKQVTSLYELSLQVLNNKIYKFAKEHCDEPCEFCSVCQTEQCSVIKPVIRMFELPENIIQRLYNEVYLEYKSIFDSNTNLLHLFLSLLRFEHTSLKINDYCFTQYDNDIPFMIKFGKKIKSLQLKDEPEQSITLDIETGATLCSTLLRSVVNVQVLDFKDITVTATLLKVVGLECTQLKVVSGIKIGDHYTTCQSFRKLLFRDDDETGTEPNKCCDTLQAINFNKIQGLYHDLFEGIQYRQQDDELNRIIFLLINNVTHLKSVGHEVCFGNYFKTFQLIEIRQAKFEDINFSCLSTEECITLKDFCPTVRKLRIKVIESGVAEKLTSFNCLEEIIFACIESNVYREICEQHWANLKIIKLSAPEYDGPLHIDVDLLINNFPVLTELYLTDCAWFCYVHWSKTTQFNCLKVVSVNSSSLYSNTTWFASFASTVQSIQLAGNDYTPVISSDDCEVLLTVPFPNLEQLCIMHILYDFQFYSSVLANLPKLEKCFMYDHKETESEKAQRMTELSQFMRENNLQCDVDHGTTSVIDYDNLL